jgi:hypothetical protein
MCRPYLPAGTSNCLRFTDAGAGPWFSVSLVKLVAVSCEVAQPHTHNRMNAPSKLSEI